MATRSYQLGILLISTKSGNLFFAPILKKLTSKISKTLRFIDIDGVDNVQSDLALQEEVRRKIGVSSLIFIDINAAIPSIQFELGAAWASGKVLIFVGQRDRQMNLPPSFSDNNFIYYDDEEDLGVTWNYFFGEYLRNPEQFKFANSLKEVKTAKIDIDPKKLESREFENLCFELLSRLGYKHLEWKIKTELIDAVSTLHKKDPDGFEYDEYWLISFVNRRKDFELFEMPFIDPEYFSRRLFRDVFERKMMDGAFPMLGKSDMPITILFILQEDNKLKDIIKKLSRRDIQMERRGFLFSFRIRWWDENDLIALLINKPSLARKYFSPDASGSSGVRLSYEELSMQYAVSNDQLRKTNELLLAERSRVEILERDAAWKLLSFTAAHRLGNPIDAIDSELANLKSAMDASNSAMVMEIIQSMEVPVEKAKSIVAQFRNLSIAHEIAPVTVNFEKLSEILKNAAKPAVKKEVSVDFALAEFPDISIDAQKISECFDELIRNALHFVGGDNPKIVIYAGAVEQGQLPVGIDQTRHYAKISFSDNGCGIPYDKKQDIFKPFEKSYIHGTGLGLAFCYAIIEKHGGAIIETGKPGEGAVFDIFLPLNENRIIK